MTNNLCTQADVEKYLNVTFGASDATVALYIARVSDFVAMYCNNDFDTHASVEEKHDGYGKHHSRIILKHKPVTAINSIDDDGTSLTETTHYEWYADGLVIRVSNGVENNKTAYWKEKMKGITVDYDWGYSSVPNDVQHAATEMVCRLLRRQFRFEEGGVVDSLSMEGISLTFTDVKTVLGRLEEDEVTKILNARTKPLIGVI